MKLMIKSIAATLIAVAAGIGFYFLFNIANGFDPAVNREEALSLNMSTTKQMFIEKSDSIQRLTAYIWENDGFTAVRRSDGGADVRNPDGTPADTREYQEYLDDVFGEYACGGTMYNIAVTGQGTYFYTSYSDAGLCGFVSENIINGTTDYETLELLETWKIFFQPNE